jgi:Outer membrane lipoprotein-sorting protein
LQQNNPNIAYASVRVWVAKQSGAMLRAEAFDAQSRLVKKFEVISGQKIEGKWFLKQMRIERYDPATGNLASRTYLEITS